MPGLYFDEIIATHSDRQVVRDGPRLIVRIDRQIHGYLEGLLITAPAGIVLAATAANIPHLLSKGDRGLVLLAILVVASVAACCAGAAVFIRASRTRHRFRELLVIDPAGRCATRPTKAAVMLPTQTRVVVSWIWHLRRWELMLQWPGGEQLIAIGRDTRIGERNAWDQSPGPFEDHMLYKCGRLTALGVAVYGVPTPR